MKLGVGLPGYLGTMVDSNLVLDWARRADEAGFAALAAHDRPDHDTWDPLVTLAAAAAVTKQARLITTTLLLPTREAGNVAKQAATIDVLSGGRFELGVGVGVREVDFAALGTDLSRRGRKLEEGLRRINELWQAAIEAGDDTGVLGPPPVQRPRPPIRVGGYQPAAYRRAVELGDGYFFGNAGAAGMAAKVPEIRAVYREAGREDLPIGGLAYFAATSDPAELARAEQNIKHYYGSLAKPFDELVLNGDDARLGERIDAYREAGIDTLYLFPVLPELAQLDALARHL